MAERENHNTVADVIGMVQRRAEAAFTLGYTGAATELRNAADEARRMTRAESWGTEEPCQRQALAEASLDALIDELGPAVAMRRLLDRHGEPVSDQQGWRCSEPDCEWTGATDEATGDLCPRCLTRNSLEEVPA